MQNPPTGNSVLSHVVSSRQKYPQIPSAFTIPCVLLLTMASRTFPATYGSLSSDPVAAKASVRNVLSSLQEFDPDTLSSENALTFKILDTYLKNASTGTDYLLYQEPLGPVSGIHTQLPVLLSEYSFYDTQDVETYLALLKETPSYFDSVIRFEQKKAASGPFMPDYQADSVLDTCQSFIDMGKEKLSGQYI